MVSHGRWGYSLPQPDHSARAGPSRRSMPQPMASCPPTPTMEHYTVHYNIY